MSANNFIAVFNVTSGIILAARTYSAGGYDNFNNQIRSMTVSSGTSPMAFVLSNYKATMFLSSCTG